jgi:hypothetical protein
MSFVELVLSSSTVLSSWLTGSASLAALACLLWSREWRTHLNLTAFVALGGALLTFMARPEWWTVDTACWVERTQAVIACGMALEAGRRWLRRWGFLPRTIGVACLGFILGTTIQMLPMSDNACMRGLVVWCAVAFCVVTEVRMAIEAQRVRTDAITEVSTRAMSWIWALQMAYRGVKEVNPMDGEFFGWLQVGVYLWAMAVICRAALSGDTK